MLGIKSPREIRHEETRTRILSVAKRLLRKDGIEKLSLRKVASESNYSPAGLYEYFKNKEVRNPRRVQQGGSQAQVNGSSLIHQ